MAILYLKEEFPLKYKLHLIEDNIFTWNREWGVFKSQCKTLGPRWVGPELGWSKKAGQASEGSHPFHLKLSYWVSGKESACNAGDSGSIPGLGTSLGEGNGKPLQYSCLEKNPTDRETWWATVQGVAKSRTRLIGSTATLQINYDLRY